MRITSSTNVKTEIVPFELDVPAPFAQKPAHDIVLAANGRRALVYDTTTEAERLHVPADGAGVHVRQLVPAWRVVVVTKSGKFLENNSRYNTNNGQVFTDPLRLLLYLQAQSQALSKVKRTTVDTSDPEE